MEMDFDESLKKMNRIIYTGGVGCLIILMAHYTGWVIYPIMINQQLKEIIILNNTTEMMNASYHPQKWMLYVYVFNITNPEEVSQGAIATVVEMGPYIYDQHKSKVDIEFTQGDTLSYKLENKMYFNANKSGRYKESDIVTVLNIPLIEMAYIFEDRFPEGLIYLNSSIPHLFSENKNLFINVLVGDLLFNGIRMLCGHQEGPAKKVCDEIRRDPFPTITDVPDSEDFIFSFFNIYNSSPSSTYKIKRGNTNVFDLGQIVEYNNLPYLDMWEENSICSELKGTDWTIFPPCFDTRDIYVFMPEACMSMNAYYIQEYNKFGLLLSRYRLSIENFDSVDFRSKNICHCKKNKKLTEISQNCPKKGVIEGITNQGDPFFYSFPHAYYSEHQSDVIGYKEVNNNEYDTEILIEPRSGIPINVYKRIQKNMMLRKLDELNILNNISERLIPLVWIDERLSDEQAQSNAERLNHLIAKDKLITTFCGILIGTGVFLLLLAYSMYSKFQKDNDVQTINYFLKEKNRTWMDGYY